MNGWYNEIEPFAAGWLDQLVADGHVAPGRVERRSITELEPADVAGPGQRHFFAGIGGWSYALRLAGIPDDADIWTGSCPCQPFSSAGARRGVGDARHLWPAWSALIRECRPPIVFGEQVASRDGLAWLDVVFADLERCGYAVGAADLCAASVGAPHKRQRLYWVAYAAGRRREIERAPWLHADGQPGHDAARCGPDVAWSDPEWIPCEDGRRPTQPGTEPLADGLPGRVGRLRGYGNAIVPQLASAFVTAALDAITG